MSFQRDLGTARERVAQHSSQVFRGSRFGDIEYRVAGQGSAVLVSHGIAGGVDQAEDLVTRWRSLSPRYRFVFVSRFGYLRSSMPVGATPRTQAEAYASLLDHLGIARVTVVGNSAGGAAAMWFAIDYPERTHGLILLSSAVPGPVPDPVPKLLAQHDFLYWAAAKLAPRRLVRLLIPASVHLTGDQESFVIDTAYLASLPISQRTAGILFDSKRSNPAVNDIPYERVHVPTLVFQASDDAREFAGGREIARRIQGSRLITMTGGHVLIGHEQQIRDEIDHFIASRGNAGFLPGNVGRHETN